MILDLYFEMAAKNDTKRS